MPDKPLLFRVVVLYPVVIVIQTGAAQIRGSSHSGAPRAPADYLRFQMINRQTFSFLPAHRLVFVSFLQKEKSVGIIDTLSASKLPVAGLRRRLDK